MSVEKDSSTAGHAQIRLQLQILEQESEKLLANEFPYDQGKTFTERAILSNLSLKRRANLSTLAEKILRLIEELPGNEAHEYDDYRSLLRRIVVNGAVVDQIESDTARLIQVFKRRERIAQRFDFLKKIIRFFSNSRK